MQPHAAEKSISPVRLAVAIPKYGLLGGAEQFVAELTERIAARPGYEVHVFANRWKRLSDRIAFHRVPIIRFPKFLTTISFAAFARRRIRQNTFDLVHAHDRIYEADLFTMHGIPHRLWIDEVRQKRMNLYDRATARVEKQLVENPRCRLFLPVSSLAGRKFLQAYPSVDPQRVHIFYPGVDVERFQKRERTEARQQVGQRYGIGTDDVLILFVSMNFEIKGLDEILRSLPHLREKAGGRNFRLLVVGKGDIAKYRLLARRLSVEPHVVFAGPVEKDELEPIYRAGDGFCMLSRFDTFGLSVLEAMAASLPVLISGNVGAKDLVRHGRNGFVVEEPGDAIGTADFLFRLFDDEARRILADEALKTARRHTWDDVVEKMHGLYERRLRHGRSGSL